MKHVITQVGEILVEEFCLSDRIPALRGHARRRLRILDEKGLSNLLGLLYEAVADPTLWTPFLESLARQTGGHAAALLMNSSEPNVHMVTLNVGMNPDVSRLYKEYYHVHDLWAARGIPQIGSGWVGTSEELCGSKEFRKTEFYNDFCLPTANVAHGMFALLSKDRDSLTNLTVYRTPKQETFGKKEVGLLKLLAPHLRRAFRLQFQLCSLQGGKRSFEMLLDSMLQGIILLGRSARVLYMNRAGRKLCEQGDGLLASASGLAAENHTESALLHGLIAQAISTSLGQGLSPGGGLQVSRKSGAPLNVVVSPVHALTTDFRETVRAIVYVTDPSLRIRPRNELLETMFGLTPAECRIALLVGDGFSAATVREMSGITANTFRTHLASIYRKTNTGRQTQLVKLISLVGMLGIRASS